MSSETYDVAISDRPRQQIFTLNSSASAACPALAPNKSRQSKVNCNDYLNLDTNFQPRRRIKRSSWLEQSLLILAPCHLLSTFCLLAFHPSLLQFRDYRHRNKFQDTSDSSNVSTTSVSSKKLSLLGLPDFTLWKDKISTRYPNRKFRMSARSKLPKRVVTLDSDDFSNILTNENADRMINRNRNPPDHSQGWALPKENSTKTQWILNDRNHSALNKCVPMAHWQTTSFPTCNSIHEINLFSTSPTFFHLILNRHTPGYHADRLRPSPERKKSFDKTKLRRKSEVLSKHQPKDEGQSLDEQQKWKEPLTRTNLSSEGKHNEIFATTSPENSTHTEKSNTLPYEQSFELLGRGWFRHAWKVRELNHGIDAALKTLRLEREFLPEYYELHRRDAVAMERLTSSPYVMNIYGFCGHTALTELAFLEKGIHNLYRLSTGLKDVNTPYVLKSKLQIAFMLSLGIAHIHSIPISDVNASPSLESDGSFDLVSGATLVHYDINPRNIVITPNGKPKVNDFNIAEFLKWDSVTKKPCGFDGRFHEPWWRAPEEMVSYLPDSKSGRQGENTIATEKKQQKQQGRQFIERANSQDAKLNEKVDVYSLGNALYVLLTGTEPRGKGHKEKRYNNVSNIVARGDRPPFLDDYKRSDDPVISALKNAIDKCWEPSAEARVSAKEIAVDLYDALHKLKRHPRYKNV